MFEGALEIVHEGLLKAAMKSDLDLYDADQMFISAKDQAIERLPAFKLDLILSSRRGVSERISDLRSRKHEYELGFWLEKHGLVDGLTAVVARAIIDEFDFQLERLQVTHPTEHHDALFDVARRRQAAVFDTQSIESRIPA
ncbi:hypothetical protein K0A96_01440 [Patescibacteria group bacterium]|nr:hypothetical protein [Patescibacteria group bacterium]